MPRGIPNQPKAQPPAAPVADSAAPMIIIQPGPAGTRLDAYNLALAEIVDELRRALIHLVATNAGVTITHTIPRDAAVIVQPAPDGSRVLAAAVPPLRVPRDLPKTSKPARNGKASKPHPEPVYEPFNLDDDDL